MRRLQLPGWARLLLRNPKSRFGIGILLFMIVIAVIAPLISVADPNGFSLAAHEAPSWHHLFGTTDQGSDVFSQVVVGTRRSLLLGAAAGALATLVAATLGIVAAYSGGIVDEVINFLINVFLVIPPIPLLIVVSGFLKNRGMSTMILVLGLVLWAFEARVLRAQALTLKNRDFVLAAKVAGESTLADRLRRADAEHGQPHRRGVRARLLHLAAHGRRPRVPRAREPLAPELGRDHVLGPDELRRAPGGMVVLPVPGRRAGAHGARARPAARRHRRGQQPAAAQPRAAPVGVQLPPGSLRRARPPSAKGRGHAPKGRV